MFKKIEINYNAELASVIVKTEKLTMTVTNYATEPGQQELGMVCSNGSRKQYVWGSWSIKEEPMEIRFLFKLAEEVFEEIQQQERDALAKLAEMNEEVAQSVE